MAQDGLSQGLALAMTHHQHFDWLQLGSKGALGGVLGSQYGNATQQRLSQHLGPGSAAVLQSEASALASGGLQAAAQHQRFDAAQVLSDNLGQAIGEGVVQGAIAQVKPESVPAAFTDNQDLGYCAIEGESEEGYSSLPKGTYERFHQEALQRRCLEALSENQPWFVPGEGDNIFNELSLFESKKAPPYENISLGMAVNHYNGWITKHAVLNEGIGFTSLPGLAVDIEQFVGEGYAAGIKAGYDTISHVKGGWNASKTVYTHYYPSDNSLYMLFKNEDGSLSSIFSETLSTEGSRFNYQMKTRVAHSAVTGLASTLKWSPILSLAGETLEYSIDSYYQIPGGKSFNAVNFTVDVGLDVPKMIVSSEAGVIVGAATGSLAALTTTCMELGAFAGPVGVLAGAGVGFTTSMIMSYGIEKVYGHYQLRENLKHKFHKEK